MGAGGHIWIRHEMRQRREESESAKEGFERTTTEEAFVQDYSFRLHVCVCDRRLVSLSLSFCSEKGRGSQSEDSRNVRATFYVSLGQSERASEQQQRRQPVPMLSAPIYRETDLSALLSLACLRRCLHCRRRSVPLRVSLSLSLEAAAAVLLLSSRFDSAPAAAGTRSHTGSRSLLLLCGHQHLSCCATDAGAGSRARETERQTDSESKSGRREGCCFCWQLPQPPLTSHSCFDSRAPA